MFEGIREMVKSWQQPKSQKKVVKFDFPKCLHCKEEILPGVRHVECDKALAKFISSVDQCIYCLKSEKEGDHLECRKTLGRIVAGFIKELQ